MQFEIPVTYDEWHEKAYNECITLGELRLLQKGDILEFINLDRNFLDTLPAMRDNQTYDRDEIIRIHTDIYTHNEDVSGTMVYHWDMKRDECKFRFELFTGKSWYPLSYQDEKYSLVTGINDDGWIKKEVNLDQFPPDTKMGWRGPCVEVEKVKNFPRYFVDVEEM